MAAAGMDELTFADVLVADAPRPEREDARHRRRERVLPQRPRAVAGASLRPPRPVAALVTQDPVHALREARSLRRPRRRHHGDPRRVVRRRRRWRPGVQKLLPDPLLHRLLASRNGAAAAATCTRRMYGASRSCWQEQQTWIVPKDGGLVPEEEGLMG